MDAFENVLGSDCEGCNEAKRLRIEHAQIIVSEVGCSMLAVLNIASTRTTRSG